MSTCLSSHKLVSTFSQSENFTPPELDIVENFDATYDLRVHGFEGAVHASFSPFFWPSIS
jgi:hypothetical protein